MATVRVFTSNSTRALLDALVPAFERTSGHRIAIESDSAKIMLARINQGVSADAAILLKPAIDELAALGKIVDASRRPFARSRIGIAVLAGARRPDIATTAALKRTLLAARAIAHTVHGASGMYFPQLAERLGITAQIKDRIVTRPGGLIGKVVAEGEAEIAFQQISELLAVPGIEVVGPLPDEVQLIIETAAGIFAASSHADAAEAWLQFCCAPTQAAVFRDKGLDRA